MFSPTHAAIAADSPLTAAAGPRMARLGGNAVDIAMAAAMAATVSEILMCSLGGSAFFMIRFPGQAAELIDGADVLPHVGHPPLPNSRAWRNVRVPYGDGIDVMVGHGTVAVPGMLAAAELAWRRHGRLPWSEIVAPALELARTKIPVSPTLARWLAMAGHLIFFQQEASRQCFFPDGDRPLAEGDTFQIPHLSHTWECIAQEGARVLYEGDLAIAFAREMKAHGGYVTRDDLTSYQAILRETLLIPSRNFQLALNPPPAVGGTAAGFLIACSIWGGVLSVLPPSRRFSTQKPNRAY